MRQAGDTNTVNPARYTADTGGVPAALASAAHKVTATYRYHYNNFVPIGPHAAVADIKSNSGIVYVQGQSLQGLPPNFATMLGSQFTPGSVRVIWYEGASSFGGGQQGEAGEQAAIISQSIGKPVRLQWMRWDQHGWDSYGPSHQYDVTMGCDANGKITVADWTSLRPGRLHDRHHQGAARHRRVARSTGGRAARRRPTPASTVRPATARRTSSSAGFWPRRSRCTAAR